jgi:tetratricopeptide (TPR) repeat protein
MRLISVTLLFLAFVLILILLFPVLFLESTASILPDQYQQSIDQYQQGIGYFLAGFAMATERPRTAADVYEFLITKHSESADLFRLKGDALVQAGDDPGALDAYNAALTRDPQNPSLMIKKARTHIRMNKKDEADLVFHQILAIQTDNPEYISVIADIALEKAQYLEAFNRYNLIISQGKGSGQTYEKRSDVIFALLTIPTVHGGASESLKSTDLYAEGMQGYERAISLNPERAITIRLKMEKRFQEMVPRTINELEGRYQNYRYLEPGELPLPL